MLRRDHPLRPLYISGHSLWLEVFSPLFLAAQDFLLAIAEPLNRPAHVHEYVMTRFSLLAAVSAGLDAHSILKGLSTLSKTNVPDQMIQFIQKTVAVAGKLRLILRNGSYYVEVASSALFQQLIADEIISHCIVESCLNDADVEDPFFDDTWMETEPTFEFPQYQSTPTQLPFFKIQLESVEIVRKRCLELSFPILEEFDFKNDATGTRLDIDLKSTTRLRNYQEKSLNKMFSNGRARSGIIVLPCGAGKTLVGITAACTIKKSCLVLCTSSVSVKQWRREFLRWSTLKDENIGEFTSESKIKFTGESGIIISTYTMLSYTGKRAYDAQKMMEFIHSKEWGFLLLDEVHVVPADVFRKVLTIVAAHCKLGLTATLIREDEKIQNLNYLIGPKLFEANWMELANEGHIANVQCAEVWCPMTCEFYGEYLRSSNSRQKQLLYIMNPRKIQACQSLIEYHEARDEKTIVFSDNVFALKHYAQKLNKPFIYGGSSSSERVRILQQFRYNPALNTIFLSKVGDTSIDLPEAACLIQISSHYGSRRQEAQRLGRILRAKKRHGGQQGPNAFFYTLVSRDTQESYFCAKRQQYLIDQGYSFKIITEIQGMENNPHLVYQTKLEQMELLNTVLIASESSIIIESEDEMEHEEEETMQKTESFMTRVTGTSLNSLSGGDAMAYYEFSRVATKKKRKF